MSEEVLQNLQRVSGFSESRGREVYFSDDEDRRVPRKRRKFVVLDEEDEGEEESRSPQYEPRQYGSPQYGSPQYGSPRYSLSPSYGRGEEEEESGTRESGGNSFVEDEDDDVYSYGYGYSEGNREECAVDRLSELPDLVLIRILSFLDMREAVTTSVLSRRWQFLWIDLPRLTFLDRDFREKGEFSAWVTRNLSFCSGNHLQKFTVSFDYNECDAVNVSAWVRFALKNKLKEVSLLLDASEDWFMLPETMYSNPSLTCLNLCGCIMEPRRTIEWESLTTLYLDNIELQEDVFGKIISGCPVLYDLSLTECWGLNYLDIDCENIRALTIENWNDFNEQGSSPLEIWAPYIDSLRISLKLEGRRLRVENISPLVRANIDFDVFDCDAEYVKLENYTDELFEGLRLVKNLEIRDGFIEVLSMLTVEGWWLPQSKREHLVVNASRDAESFPGIVCLLESSPKLKTLVINGYFGRSNQACFPDGPPTSYLKKEVLKKALSRLKTVNISNFAEPSLHGEPMQTLVKLLLERATVLEKMVLDFSEFTRSFLDDYITMAETLISYPRSSPKAVVLLKR